MLSKLDFLQNVRILYIYCRSVSSMAHSDLRFRWHDRILCFILPNCDLIRFLNFLRWNGSAIEKKGLFPILFFLNFTFFLNHFLLRFCQNDDIVKGCNPHVMLTLVMRNEVIQSLIGLQPKCSFPDGNHSNDVSEWNLFWHFLICLRLVDENYA